MSTEHPFSVFIFLKYPTLEFHTLLVVYHHISLVTQNTPYLFYREVITSDLPHLVILP